MKTRTKTRINITPSLFSDRQIASFNIIIDWWIQKQEDGANESTKEFRAWFWSPRINEAKELKRLINYEFKPLKYRQ